MSTSQKYGPWAIVAGASDGTGAAFAVELARRGINLVLVARREQLLEELAAQLDVETRVLTLDLADPAAIDALARATDDLEIGLVVYNAGADAANLPMLRRDIEELRGFVIRNCNNVMEASYHFGRLMVARGRGGLLLVTSGAAWAGANGLAPYGATKAFDLVLAESLWAEWRAAGVDVLGLVLGATDTPALRRSLATHGGDMGELADPAAIAVEAIEHLADGPTWSYGMPDPGGPSPLGGLPRRTAVELMSAGAAAMYADGTPATGGGA
jgi:short-subunit dehydrogenase